MKLINIFKKKQVELPNHPPRDTKKIFLQVVFVDGTVIETSVVGTYSWLASDKLSDAVHGTSMFIRLVDNSSNYVNYYNKSTIKKIIIIRTEPNIVEYSY
jgi:hypothetical protein